MKRPPASTGHGLIARHGLWSDAQRRLAGEVAERVVAERLSLVRLGFADQHGILRGKTLTAAALPSALRDGCTMTSTLLSKDTSHRTVYPIWQARSDDAFGDLAGGGDVFMVPDPATFHVLPWTEGVGWMQCDLYYADGRPVPFDTRRLCRDVLARLDALGYALVTGLEVEFHLYRLLDPKLAPHHATQPCAAPEVELLHPGYQYLTEVRMDRIEDDLNAINLQLQALGLPVRSLEVEFGPSQVEITLQPGVGLESADQMVLLRNAIKQSAARRGLHATFMCRPNLVNAFSSGWHLHQSLRDNASGANAFVPDDDAPLSPLGQHYVAGLLQHARASCVFTTPTINGYKRYRPYSLAPDRVLWGRDNRGAMLRVLGGAGDPSTHVENRVGEPAANPYLYLMSQALSGMLGIQQQLQPASLADAPYDTAAERLPVSLIDALFAFRDDPMYARELGEDFVRYYAMLKQAEVDRYMSEVTDWEQREYFGLF